MVVGRVDGTVVCSKQDKSLDGRSILVIQPVKIDTLESCGQKLVALDPFGAGPGELVLVVGGSSARLAADFGNKVTVDQSIIAIIDNIDMEGRSCYRKGYSE
jgi:ethanolamine utilization protein EutN